MKSVVILALLLVLASSTSLATDSTTAVVTTAVVTTAEQSTYYLACSGGATLNEESGTISFANATSTSSYLHCRWYIEVPYDKVMNITITKFNLKEESCCYKYLDVRDNGQSVYGTLYESSVLRSFESISNRVEIVFNFNNYSGGNVTDDGMFQLRWETVEPSITTDVASFSCGQTISSRNGQISFPADGGNYENNLDCQWNISAKADEYVLLTVKEMDIEYGGDCRWDYLKIVSDEILYYGFQNNQKLCGKRIHDSFYGDYYYYHETYTVKSSAIIQFHSDDVVNGAGFKLSYQVKDSSFQACVESEGITYTTPSGTITSIDLDFLHYLHCQWTITVDANSVIHMNFNDAVGQCTTWWHDLSLRENFPSRTEYVGHLCEHGTSKPYTSTSNSVTVTFHQYYYHHYSELSTSFNITWTSEEASNQTTSDLLSCSNYMNITHGIISSPGYPNNYSNNADECWVIPNPSNFQIRLQILELDVESSLHCQYDHLLFIDSATNNVERYCSPWTNTYSFSGNLTIVFRSDSSITKRGFILAYGMSESGTAEDTSCGSEKLTDTAGFVFSPGFPYRSPTDARCEWTLAVPANQKMEGRFLSLNLRNIWVDSSCSWDYVEVTPGNNGNTKRICRSAGDAFQTTANTLNVTFVSSNDTINFGGFGGFFLLYEAKENKTTTECGGTLDGVTSLYNPNYPGVYPHDADCYWTIPVQQNEVLTMNIGYIHIELSDDCSADVVEFYSVNNPTPQRFCGPTYDGSFSYAYESDVTIHFRSDFLVAENGFYLFWRKIITGTIPVTTTQTTTIPTTTKEVAVAAFAGKDAILLDFEDANRNTGSAISATRSYSVSVSDGGNSFVNDVDDVQDYLIIGLNAGATYSVLVNVNEDGIFVAAVTLSATTTKDCTKTCTNSKCILMSQDDLICRCLSGYEKSTTENDTCTDVDECAASPIPCPDNSVCSNTGGSYSCVCLNGYEKYEDRCENFTVCARDPCFNNGTCVPEGSQFSCKCPQYFYGTRCKDYLDPCLSAPCRHGGKCTDLRGDYLCTCPPAYEGRDCDEDVNECTTGDFTCLNNSFCQNKPGGYDCVCKDGYRGDGKEKCYEVILLPYGPNEGDKTLIAVDNVASPTIKMPFGLPIGIKSFTAMNIISNGFISLGPQSWSLGYLNRPWGNGFGFSSIGMIAPFWDDFHPSYSSNGRVHYQVYDQLNHTLINESSAVVEEIARRINNFAKTTDFEPLFVVKVTWHEVLMSNEEYNRGYPSTFQAIIATDLSDTFLIFNYKEDAMLFDTKKRYSWSNRGLIGYTNGAELEYIEVQGNYRPDQRVQDGGSLRGQYYYHVAKSLTQTDVLAARGSCLAWYRREKANPWQPGSEPCPCTRLQAIIDRRFTPSVDLWLWWTSRYNWGNYRSGDTAEWAYDEVPRGNCYQLRVDLGNNSTPRCCYASRENTFSWWWGWWDWGPLLQGEFGSRYERHQIPIVDRRDGEWSWVHRREVSKFNMQYNQSLEYDLIPRRKCCVESQSAEHCKLYREMRPAASCKGYVRRVPAFNFGDPHITTSDGVLYTFNGLGEYHMVYAPGIFSLQCRTQKAAKEDGSESDATAFAAFAAKDLAIAESGAIQFEIDRNNSNGDGLIVKVDGEIVTNITDDETTVNLISLTFDNGTYQAVFPSSQSLSVSAANFLLNMQFTGDTGTMQNKSRGLLGYWDGIEENDFEMRNGTVIDWSSIQPTRDLDILNGTLLERELYPFGQSWKVLESESIFNYSGDKDTYDQHNPSSAMQPPFLEDLVAEQRTSDRFAAILSNCTSNGIISTTCLYDVLTTNRSDIGENTLADADSSAAMSTSNKNSPPSITLVATPNVDADGKTLMAKVDETSTYTFEATDPDEQSVTFSLDASNPIPGMSIDSVSGVVTWTPTNENLITSSTNWTLTVIAKDSAGAESILSTSIKLCACANNGSCVYEETTVGGENYQLVGCICTEAYTGDKCREDRNGCELSACYPNVTCVDAVAPEVGEICGDCPPGTTGDGRNCTNIDLCDPNPCEQICESLYNDFSCSCSAGYDLIDDIHCSDVDECSTGDQCAEHSNTVCVNSPGNFSCSCANGFEEKDEGCVDVDECLQDTHSCSPNSTQCFNTPGSFTCPCLGSFTRPEGSTDKSTCEDLDECIENLNTCSDREVCVNLQPSYRCDCQPGFHKLDGVCQDVKECDDSALNICGNRTTFCVEMEGSYECSCYGGYEKVDGVCQNVNECLDLGACSDDKSCTDTDGGYTCLSRVIDDCSSATSLCPDNSNCIDFTCTCLNGFEMVGKECLEMNACTSAPCPENSNCDNSAGSYSCSCKEGFEMNEDKTKCVGSGSRNAMKTTYLFWCIALFVAIVMELM